MRWYYTFFLNQLNLPIPMLLPGYPNPCPPFPVASEAKRWRPSDGAQAKGLGDPLGVQDRGLRWQNWLISHAGVTKDHSNAHIISCHFLSWGHIRNFEFYDLIGAWHHIFNYIFNWRGVPQKTDRSWKTSGSSQAQGFSPSHPCSHGKIIDPSRYCLEIALPAGSQGLTINRICLISSNQKRI